MPGSVSGSGPGPGRAVVFDCDGLLLDTERSWAASEEELFRLHGHTYTAEHQRLLLGASGPETGRILAGVFGLPGKEKQLAGELRDLCWETVVEGARPMPGAAELVAELHGRVPLGVASNSPARLVREALSRAGFDGAFQQILGEEDVSRPKPEPEIYLSACARLGVDPRASIALEDSPPGAAAARAAGMYVIGVPSEPGTSLDADAVAGSLSHPSVLTAIARKLSDTRI